MKNLILTMLLSPMLFSGSPIIWQSTNRAQNLAPNGLIIGSGSVSVPSVSISGSTSTGIYSTGANNLDFTSNGIQFLNSNATANVTIGNVAKISSTDYAGNKIVGATNGNTTGAGYAGEVITGSAVDTTNFTTGTARTVSTLALTAGKWMIYGQLYFDTGAGTASLIQASISATTNAIDNASQTRIQAVIAGQSGLTMMPRFVNISASTNYYLVGVITISSSTWNPNASASTIYAIRQAQ